MHEKLHANISKLIMWISSNDVSIPCPLIGKQWIIRRLMDIQLGTILFPENIETMFENVPKPDEQDDETRFIHNPYICLGVRDKAMETASKGKR